MNFLFLCTGNSCRSILSEALLMPVHRKVLVPVAPAANRLERSILTLKTLQNLGISTQGLSSKTMQDCEQFNPQVVITVCGSAAAEPCPLYLGKAIKAHWGLEDPSHLEVSEDEKMQAFMQMVEHINRRFDAFFALDLAHLSP